MQRDDVSICYFILSCLYRLLPLGLDHVREGGLLAAFYSVFTQSHEGGREETMHRIHVDYRGSRAMTTPKGGKFSARQKDRSKDSVYNAQTAFAYHRWGRDLP